MCGIIGAVAETSVQHALMQGLKSMEYRGYDSAGICLIDNGLLHCVKREGKLANLERALAEAPVPGATGIGHTRWATHGGPSQINAHPHCAGPVAIVHNGIIENYAVLKAELEKAGADFVSETDSESVAWLLKKNCALYDDLLTAWKETLAMLDGAYAIAAVHEGFAQRLLFARKGSPMLLGRSGGAVYVASDALAIAGLAEEVIYLREGEWGCVTGSEVVLFGADGAPVDCHWRVMPVTVAATEKGPYAHYMLKEIFEQPRVMADIMGAYVSDDEIVFSDAPLVEEADLPDRIVIVACGTSYHAALTARYWIERYLQIPVEVDVASEYRYRDPVIGPHTWLITLSQSGETADTLEALRLFKHKTPLNRALAICNVPHASLVRESDGLIELHAGPEVGVASTKAYTAQLAVLALLSLKLAHRAGAMAEGAVRKHLGALHCVGDAMTSLLNDAPALDRLTPLFANVHGALYLGRGPCFPLALEGALKLKEISYLHAEGYAAGEMKHGPIALIDKNLPVIVMALKQYHLEKVISNLREVQARGAKVILLTDMAPEAWPQDVDGVVAIPEGDYFTAPLLAAIPLQLIAYNVARARGTDVDQPRNLAKSVTVE